MMFQKRLEKAMKTQKELSGLNETEDESKERPQRDISRKEAFGITAFAMLYFIPICLVILLLLCLICAPYLFF